MTWKPDRLVRVEEFQSLQEQKMYLTGWQGSLGVEIPAALDAPARPDLDEEALVLRAQRNDARALSAVYELYFERIYRYVVINMDDRSEAEDITQEVFIKVLRSINRYKITKAPFAAWLYRIAKNQVIDHQRQRRAARRHCSMILIRPPVRTTNRKLWRR